MKVFHKDVFMPDAVYLNAAMALCRLGGRYRLSRHATERMTLKGVTLPDILPVAQLEIIEVTAGAKMLLRFPFGGKDVVIGLTNDGLVTTVYNNDSTDHHSTLDSSKYEVEAVERLEDFLYEEESPDVATSGPVQ